MAGRYDEALATRQRSLELTRAHFGEESAAFAHELSNLAALQNESQHPVEARATLERALGILDRLHVPADPMRGNMESELAVLGSRAGDEAAAVRHAEASLAIAERVNRPDAPELALALLHNATAIGMWPHQRDRAIHLLERARSILEASDPDGETLGGVLAITSQILVQAGRAREAIEPAERAVVRLADAGNPFNRGAAHFSLGKALLDAGEARRGRAELAAARKIFLDLGAANGVADVDRALASAPRR
jgi:tetratricopeptide (TPR) repeat protein